MMREPIAVTGAEGFLGSHLVELLVHSGRPVRAMVQYNSFGSWGWLDTLAADVLDRVTVVMGDVRDPASPRELIEGCEVVVHLAALISVPHSYGAARQHIDTNVVGTLNVLDAVRVAGTRLMIHTSTSETYGTARSTLIDEDHPQVAQSPYAASKIGADKLVESYWRTFGLPVVTLRPFNTFGPRQSLRAVIPTVICQVAAGSREIRLGSLKPVRDFTYCRDAARAFLSVIAATPERVIGSALNIGTGVGVCIGDLVTMIGTLMGVDVEVVQEHARLRPEESEVMRLVCDSSRLRDATTWTPRYTLVGGLCHTIEWFRRPANLGRYRISAHAT